MYKMESTNSYSSPYKNSNANSLEVYGLVPSIKPRITPNPILSKSLVRRKEDKVYDLPHFNLIGDFDLTENE